ncbi:MAG: helix-turn-helix domain-containing protein [Phycisphaerales bacterium]|nr:helix-turn-helix domain-containing protein [Phycisphaerales bacterium]
MSTKPRLLTVQELATELSVQPETVRRWARDGRIPALRVSGKTIRFDLEDVCAMLRRVGTKGVHRG